MCCQICGQVAAVTAQFVGLGLRIILRLDEYAPATQTQVLEHLRIKLSLLLEIIQELKVIDCIIDISTQTQIQVLNACLEQYFWSGSSKRSGKCEQFWKVPASREKI